MNLIIERAQDNALEDLLDFEQDIVHQLVHAYVSKLHDEELIDNYRTYHEGIALALNVRDSRMPVLTNDELARMPLYATESRRNDTDGVVAFLAEHGYAKPNQAHVTRGKRLEFSSGFRFTFDGLHAVHSLQESIS